MSGNISVNNTTISTEAKILETSFVFVIPVLSIATIAANGLVCFVVWKDPYKRLKSPFTPYVVNLCVTDFLVGLITQPLHMAYRLTDPQNVKDYHEMFFVILSSASTLSLCLLCFDRYNAMVYPLTYRTRDRGMRSLVLLTIVWIISIVYPIVVYITYKNESAYEKLRYYFLHVVVMITFLVLLLTCSSIIMCKNKPEMPIIRYHSEDSSTDQADEETFAKCKRIAARMSDSSILLESLRRRFSSSRDTKLLELRQLSQTFNKPPRKVGPIFFVMLCEFVTCFLPPIILVNCKVTTVITEEIIHLSVALFSLLNPFVYCWRLSSYRRAFRAILGMVELPHKPSYHSSCSSAPSPSMIGIELRSPNLLSTGSPITASMKRRAFLLAGKSPALRESVSDSEFGSSCTRDKGSVSSARSVSFNV